MRQLVIIFLLIFSASAEAKSHSVCTPPGKSPHHSVKKAEALVTIDSLRVGQEYFIRVQSNGCFHHTELFLIIQRSKDGYFATFKMRGKIEGHKVNHSYKKDRLTVAQLDSVRSFETSLAQIAAHTYNCTTVDTYQLSIGETSKQYKVDHCEWQGIGKLAGFLFKGQNNKRTT